MVDQKKTPVHNFFNSDFVQHLQFSLVLRSFLAPIDRVILFQQTIPNYNSGFLTTLKTIIKKEGWSQIARGNLYSCLKTALHYATEFSTFNYLSLDKKVDAWLAGSLAGSMAFFVSYPLDVKRNVVTRSQNSTIPQDVIFNRPLKHLYRGFLVGLLGNSLFSGIKFQIYTTMNEKPKYCWLAGPTSGFVALLFTYPFDVVKKRMQLYAFDQYATYSMSDFSRNLYGGFKMSCIRTIPIIWVTMAFNDHIKNKKIHKT